MRQKSTGFHFWKIAVSFFKRNTFSSFASGKTSKIIGNESIKEHFFHFIGILSELLLNKTCYQNAIVNCTLKS